MQLYGITIRRQIELLTMVAAEDAEQALEFAQREADVGGVVTDEQTEVKPIPQGDDWSEEDWSGN